jgi:hypothetical protein
MCSQKKSKEVIMFSAKVREKSTGKNGYLWLLAVLLIPVAALILGAAVPNSWADDDDDEEEIPFDEAEIFFELNNTDGDLGIHALIDGEAWKELEIEDPRGRELLNIRVKSRLRRQGLTEIFFESAEPPFESEDPDEVTLTPEEFFERFLEGDYEIEGETLEGDELESVAFLSHVMPAPPDNIMVSGVPIDEGCDEDNVEEVTEPVIISWAAVEDSHPWIGNSGDIEVEKYLVVVEDEESGLLFSFELPADVTSLELPEGLTESGVQYKFEILVQEETGNKTAVESCFEVVLPTP